MYSFGLTRAAGIACALSLLASAAAPAGAATIDEIGRLVPGFYAGGSGGFAVADFDGDGHDDIVMPAISGGSTLFEVIGAAGGEIVQKQIVLLPDLALVRVLVEKTDGGPHLLTVALDGTVREFGGWPLAEIRNFNLGVADFASAAIGDIDGDGAEELVVVSDPNSGAPFVGAWDMATGTQRWMIAGTGGRDVLLEQIDADAALEIVVAGIPGVVMDGATQATDWTYKDGFGAYLAGGHFSDGGGAQFVAARDWDLFTVFQSAPYSPLWDASVFDIDAIAAADLDGDGFDEIIEGDGQWGSVNIYDSRTQQVRLSIPHGAWGMNALATADLGISGRPSIAFSPIQADFADDELFRIVDAIDGSTQWEIDDAKPGPFTPVALGDVDGDGATEFLYASQGNGYSQGVISELDALTGSEEWQSPVESGNANDPYYMSPVSIRVIPGAAGSAGEIIVAGTSIYSGRILGIDGTSHDVRWQTGFYASGPMNDRYLADMTTADLDGDGTPEIAVCTYAADTGTSGVRLFVFSSVDGSTLWESIAMGTGFDVCNGVMAGQFDQSSQQLIVAVLPGSLRAFDAQSHLLAWTLPVDADGASLLDQGVSGHEFAVFHENHVAFYDGASRALLREFDLDGTVTAIREIRDIHNLLVAASGHLLVVDGVSGAVRASSEFLGNGLGAANQIAADQTGATSFLVGIGSEVGVFRFDVRLSETIFADGFDD